MSTTSDTIGKLALSLSKAQGQITGALKDSSNPFFKSKYADIASVWDACRSALSENELAVVQTTSGDASNVTVITTLIHSSSEWISGSLTIKPSKADAQGIGSALTYARRYGLSAIVGVAQIDDDGNAASKTVVKPKTADKEFEVLLSAVKTATTLDGLRKEFDTTMEWLKSTDAPNHAIEKLIEVKDKVKDRLQA